MEITLITARNTGGEEGAQGPPGWTLPNCPNPSEGQTDTQTLVQETVAIPKGSSRGTTEKIVFPPGSQSLVPVLLLNYCFLKVMEGEYSVESEDWIALRAPLSNSSNSQATYDSGTETLEHLSRGH